VFCLNLFGTTAGAVKRATVASARLRLLEVPDAVHGRINNSFFGGGIIGATRWGNSWSKVVEGN
jgi:hypothetical protein